MAYPFAFTGGVHVATADVDGDGADEIITGAGPGGAPHIKAFFPDGTGVTSLMAYSEQFSGGVDAAGGDIDGDGVDEIITGAGPGGGPHVRVLGPDGHEFTGFMAYSSAFHGGVHVSSADPDNDGLAEVITGAGPGGAPHVRLLHASGSEILGYMAYSEAFRGGADVAGGAI
jgi:hypothetical protein